MSKPLNSSVRVLNKKLNITDQYTEVFNVTTSLSYLLIMGDEKFTLNFTDPNGNTITFIQNPEISYYSYHYYSINYYYPHYYDYDFISSYLIKSPAEGSWTINAWGNGSLTVQILGFTGNCSDSDCHPNATCGEFGGDQQCTCKEGFAGDGIYCNDIDECRTYLANKCYYYGGGSCVNTVGSYTCNCASGFQYIEEFGCVDIDECADSSLNSCDPAAICTNNIESYTCTCPYGYYGDGRHCEVNECQQGTLCNSTEDCFKYIGSYSCTDPCSNHNILNEPWRSTSNTNKSMHCDFELSGWYRFIGEYDQQIPEHCVPQYSCGTYVSIWMNGSHPAVSDGVVNRTACTSWYDGCCTEPFNISVRMCPEGFYVYKLQKTHGCSAAYCTENQINITTTISPSTPAVPYHRCNMREGTSITLLMEKDRYTWYEPKSLENILNVLSARFPCVTRQYTSIIVNNDETTEIITTEKDIFMQTIHYGENPRDLLSACNHSILHGLKRALEISPTESVILVHSLGSMKDYNDAQLLSDIYTLLEEKKSQFLQSLELILSKPVNSSVRILNKKLNVTDQYTEMFNVTTSLSYLLIMGDDTFTLNFTDPNENTITFKQKPGLSYFYSSYHLQKHYDSLFISSNLIKSPAEGSWTINVQGNGSLTVQILGFTGNCSDSDCHPNATCGEFGGDQQCTCKVGFMGNGSYCNDIDECQFYFTSCNWYNNRHCLNTIGSYTCNCYPGLQYDEVFGCVEIDECADSSLNNCDPAAICTNNIGSYTCTCPYGYYGDGRHCEVNECQQGTPCNSTEECNKYIGSYSCINPCSDHTVLNNPWRSTSNLYNSWYCDNGLSGWYRFKGEYNQQIPERCIPQNSCGTTITIWMNGSHPAVSDGVVNRTACSNYYSGCCTQPFNISVRMCPEGFYVYKLQRTPICNSAYCTETTETITTDNKYFHQILFNERTPTDYNYVSACNQSLLYGLKRALEISPAESVILVYTFGSMTDYNNTQLLSDVYTLLEEKKSQFLQSLELILSKPLNLSVRILNKKLNVTDQYTETFNVTTSFSYLLITGDEKFTLNFTDPNENTITFKQNPWIAYYYYTYYYYSPSYYDSVFISSHLIKSPAEGSWTINAEGNGSLTIQILGFTGNCSDSVCHPYATCGEFGGDQQCTCKEGFAGNGSYCNDTDECQDFYANNCNYYGGGSCVNTIGSYTCNCNSGFHYVAEFGCDDIDECADSSLNNCNPAAMCTNNIGSYTCTCSYGYYGDGRHCEVNECQQGTPCNSNLDCNKYSGSYSCTDPCSNHNILNDPWRSTSNTINSLYCDSDLSGWYRFIGEYNQQIPERCVPENRCGSEIPIWMNGSHPAVSDGVVNRKACSHWYDGCCTRPFNISVRMCPEGFYVYKLQKALICNSVYCTENQAKITTTISPSTPANTYHSCNKSETNETITTEKDDFWKVLQYERSSWDNNRWYACNQSLLYGLKRALEISPAESVILVTTLGSMTDYNDTQLLSDVYTLLEEKKSQVYFLLIPGYCTMSDIQKEIFNNISSNSFGEFINVGYYYYHQVTSCIVYV
ncbi:uncharacterized protein ACMZJ9_009898 [Mantella aurantiaca]